MRSFDRIVLATALATAPSAFAQEAQEDFLIVDEGVPVEQVVIVEESEVAFGAGVGRAYARQYNLCPSDSGREIFGAPTMEDLVAPMEAAEVDEGTIRRTVLGIAYGCRDERARMLEELTTSIQRGRMNTVE